MTEKRTEREIFEDWKAVARLVEPWDQDRFEAFTKLLTPAELKTFYEARKIVEIDRGKQ